MNYDDFFQKYLHEDNPDLGPDSGEQMIGGNETTKFFKKIFYEFRPLNDCIFMSSSRKFMKITKLEYTSLFTFIFRNQRYHLSVSIALENENSSRADLCILYQKIDYQGNLALDLWSNIEDSIHIEEWENLDVKEMCKVLQNNFEVLLKKLGFNEEYNSIQEHRMMSRN